MGKKPLITLNEFKELAVRSIEEYYRGETHYVPMLLEGASGLGKTAIMNQIAKELSNRTGVEWDLYTFIAGQRSASDILGIPFPNDDNKSVTWLKEKDMPGVDEMFTKPNGIFFLDEITVRTDEALRNAMLQLTIERKFLGYHLPKGWVILCAGNRQSDGNSYEKLSFPQRNRLECYELQFSKSELINWQSSSGVNPIVTAFIKRCTSISEFITYDPEKEENGGENGEEVDETNYVNATPRSWEYVSNALNSYEKKPYDMNLLIKKVQSLIGSETGSKFMEFYIQHAGKKLEGYSMDDLRKIDNLEDASKVELDEILENDALEYIVNKITVNSILDSEDLNILQVLVAGKTKYSTKYSLIMLLDANTMSSIRTSCLENSKLDLLRLLIKTSEELQSNEEAINMDNLGESLDRSQDDGLSWGSLK